MLKTSLNFLLNRILISSSPKKCPGNHPSYWEESNLEWPFEDIKLYWNFIFFLVKDGVLSCWNVRNSHGICCAMDDLIWKSSKTMVMQEREKGILEEQNQDQFGSVQPLELLIPSEMSGKIPAPEELEQLPREWAHSQTPEFGERSQGGILGLSCRAGAGSMIPACPSTQDIPPFHDSRTYSTKKIQIFPTTPPKPPMGSSETSKALPLQGAIPGGSSFSCKNIPGLRRTNTWLEPGFFSPTFSTWGAHLENPNIGVFRHENWENPAFRPRNVFFGGGFGEQLETVWSGNGIK